MAEHSDLAMTYAIKGMVPSNTIGDKALTRLLRRMRRGESVSF